MGEVPDGVYNALGGTLELIAGPKKTVAQLKRAASLAREIRNLEEPEARRKISDEMPEFLELWESLPDVKQKAIAFAALLVSFVHLLLFTYNVFLRGSPAQEKTNELLEQTIKQSRRMDKEDIERLGKEIEDASPPDSTSPDSTPEN